MLGALKKKGPSLSCLAVGCLCVVAFALLLLSDIEVGVVKLFRVRIGESKTRVHGAAKNRTLTRVQASATNWVRHKLGEAQIQRRVDSFVPVLHEWMQDDANHSQRVWNIDSANDKMHAFHFWDAFLRDSSFTSKLQNGTVLFVGDSTSWNLLRFLFVCVCKPTYNVKNISRANCYGRNNVTGAIEAHWNIEIRKSALNMKKVSDSNIGNLGVYYCDALSSGLRLLHIRGHTSYAREIRSDVNTYMRESGRHSVDALVVTQALHTLHLYPSRKSRQKSDQSTADFNWALNQWYDYAKNEINASVLFVRSSNPVCEQQFEGEWAVLQKVYGALQRIGYKWDALEESILRLAYGRYKSRLKIEGNVLWNANVSNQTRAKVTDALKKMTIGACENGCEMRLEADCKDFCANRTMTFHGADSIQKAQREWVEKKQLQRANASNETGNEPMVVLLDVFKLFADECKWTQVGDGRHYKTMISNVATLFLNALNFTQ